MHQRIKQCLKRVPSGLSLLSGATFLWILTLLLFYQDDFAFAYRNESIVSNLMLIGVVILVIAGMVWICQRAKKHQKPKDLWWILIYFVGLLMVQFVIVKSVWFYPGWDVAMCYESAEWVASGASPDMAYFQLCPNNAPITALLAIPLWFAIQIGLAVPYAVLPYCGAILQNLTCLMAVLCVRKMTKKRIITILMTIFVTLWIGLSEYMVVPYTDVWGILFPVLGIYVWLTHWKAFPKWFLITLVCFFGATIKPSIIILWIALMMISAFQTIPKMMEKQKIAKRLAVIALAIILGIIPAKMWQNVTTTIMAGTATPEGQLCETHYIMMGMNGDTYGGHSPDDVEYSSSFETIAQRRVANLTLAWERVSERTFVENVEFFSVKAYKAYADGTFGINCGILTLEDPDRSDTLSIFLRDIYRLKGQYFPLYATVMQGIWIGVLALCLFASVACRKRKEVALLALTLLGLTMYLLLVEVWTRYVFVYTPIFLMLAMLGLEGLTNIIKCKEKKG